MRIVELKASNVKRLKAVHIKPDGSLVHITGRNAQGKSSVLDAIMMALGGKDAQPPKPVRHGEKQAAVTLDIGDYIVIRAWDGEKQTLTVKSKDGARYSSPQKILDGLVGELTFDPLGFTRMSPKDQLATLKRVAQLDFAALDGKRADLFEERTTVNRTVKQLEGQLAFMPEVQAPDEEVSVQALFEEQQRLNEVKAANYDARRELELAQETLIDLQADIQQKEQDGKGADRRHQEEIDRLKTLLDTAIKRQAEEAASWAQAVEKSKADAADQKQHVAKLQKHVAALQDPDLSAISQQLAEADEINKRVRAKHKRAEALAELEASKSLAEQLTEAIGNIDATKQKMLADAKLPVEGLGFTDEGVTVNGLPFEQASSAEQLRISTAMSIALNPQLRISLIRDGSLLDNESLQILAEMAEKHDLQVWLERVTNGEPVGVVIEDGMVAG